MADVAVPAVDNTNRFTGRADAYVKYRRSYPPEAIRLVAKYFHLPSDATILDLGSGTGILSRQLLDLLPKATTVIGLEPNPDMRHRQETNLSAFMPRFCSLAASAEATALSPHSITVALAASAFHWFDPPLLRKEILRVVKPVEGKGHPFAIVTPTREVDHTEGDEHWVAFGELMRRFRMEMMFNHTAEVLEAKFSQESLQQFFGGGWETTRFRDDREMTLEQMIGSMASYSSVPSAGTKEWDAVAARVKEYFHEWQRDGKVVFLRECAVYHGYVREVPEAGMGHVRWVAPLV